MGKKLNPSLNLNGFVVISYDDSPLIIGGGNKNCATVGCTNMNCAGANCVAGCSCPSLPGPIG